MPDMSDLIQLVYASRSNLHSHSDPAEIEAGIGHILLEARRNNGPREIGGVLCFGDDFFFQCLEGERTQVEGLYDRIQADDRHRDVTLLLKRPVPQRRFKLWSMKYLSLDRAIRDVLDERGLKCFDPFKFDSKCTLEMLNVLQKAVERQHHSHRSPHWSLSRKTSGDEGHEHRPLTYLGVGAVVAAVAAIVIFAVGLR